MKKFYYPIMTIVSQPDFTERKVMTEANVQGLFLGPIQARRYFEAVAILSRNYSFSVELDKKSYALIKKYNSRGAR